MINFTKLLKGLRLIPNSSTQVSEKGDVEVLDSSGKINYHNGTTASPVLTEAHSASVTNKTIDADQNTLSNIDNADIKAAAAIDRSKLASGTANRVAVNNGSGVLSDAAAITASRALISDANGIPTHSTVTDTELGYVSGVSSSIQTQINGKQASGNYITDLTGDVTASGPGSAAATIANSAVSNAKMANMAAHTFKGNNTGSSAAPSDLSATQLTAELNNFVGDSGSGGTKGLVPAPAAGDAAAGKVLKADGSWGAAGTASPLTTKGDVYVYSTTNDRLPVGTNGYVLTADSAQSTGLKWAAASAGFSVTDAITLTAGASISISTSDRMQTFRVQGNSAAISLSSTVPFGSSAPTDGTMIQLVGNSDTNTVSLSYSDTAKGYVGPALTLGKYDVVSVQYISALDRYVLVSVNF